MARGWWNTSLRDKAKAQYQADQIAAALATTKRASTEELNEAYRRGFADGRQSALGEMRRPQ